MAREFSKRLYQSKAWKECREYIFKKYHGLCNECGKPGEEVHHIKFLTPSNIDNTDITMGEDNLVLLCKNCHFKKHRNTNPLVKNFKKPKRYTSNGTYFDEEGNLCRCQTYIVHGSPASGKTTYVREHKKDGDLVVDLDLILQGISMQDKTNLASNLLDIAIGIRSYIYKRIEDNSVDSRSIWVVGMLPSKKEREDIANRLNAQLVHIDTDMSECMTQAKNDDERANKQLQYSIIEDYFSKVEA
ncbi:MAG: HNH endonuclease [Peptostreptococcaceae bacterium]